MAAIADEYDEPIYDDNHLYIPDEDPNDAPKPSVKPFLMTEEEKAKKQAEDVSAYKAFTESLIKRRAYYDDLIKLCTKSGPSKKLRLSLNHGQLGMDTKTADPFVIVPLVFRDPITQMNIFERYGVAVEAGHITTPQQIERILLHVVMSTEFKELHTRHNRYFFHFDKMEPQLLSLLITEILNSNSKRINYSWVAPLQDLVIASQLNKPKKKKTSFKKSFGLPPKKSPSLPPSWINEAEQRLEIKSFSSSSGLMDAGVYIASDERLKQKIEARKAEIEGRRRGGIRQNTAMTVQSRIGRLSTRVRSEIPMEYLEQVALSARTYDEFLKEIKHEYYRRQEGKKGQEKPALGTTIANSVPVAPEANIHKASIGSSTFYSTKAYFYDAYGAGTGVSTGRPIITGTGGPSLSAESANRVLESMRQEHLAALKSMMDEPKVERIIPKTPPTMNAGNETQW